MDIISKKKTNNSFGSDIDEEDIDEEDIEGCLEDLEDIANEIIASDIDSECEQAHKEMREERQDYNKIIKVEEDKMPSQTESHKTVSSELVQSIKKHIQDLIKVKNETIETIAASASKNTEIKVNYMSNSNLDCNSNENPINHSDNSNLDHSSTKDNFNCVNKCNLEHYSDGEVVSDENISNPSPKNKYEIVEGTEIISDNSEWDHLESGECSSSEGALHKLCDDDVEYLSDATTVTGEDKSQIKKSVQEYYKKSEECFLLFYNAIKHDLTECTKNVDCNSFKSKSYSCSDSNTRKMLKLTCHDDYNKAKLVLREVKRKSSLYKKNQRQNDIGHNDKVTGNEVLTAIISQLDSHMDQELCNRMSDELKNKLSRLKKNVKKYEKKLGLRKRVTQSKKSKMLISESGRIKSNNIELNYRNTDGRESKYTQDKTKRSPEKSAKNIHLSCKNIDRRKLRHSLEKTKKSPEKPKKIKNSESRNSQHDHSNRRDSTSTAVKHNRREKLKILDKLSEKEESKKLTILSYLEDCEKSTDRDQMASKERKLEKNTLKKKQENLECRETKTSSLSGPNKQPGKQTDNKKIDPNYDNDELFITYSELMKNDNNKCNEQRKEETCKDRKDVSVFAMTLSSEYGKNSTIIPFLQDEADGFNTKVQSKELNQTHQVSYPTRECDLKNNLYHESQRTGSEKTKPYQAQVSNMPSYVESPLRARSFSTSPFRTSSRSRSTSQNRITVERRERYSRRSRSRSCSSSIIVEKEKYSKLSKTTPYAYRRKHSRSRSRTRHYKRHRSPSPHYRKRYQSRSRIRRRRRSSDRSKRRKYYTSSSEERDNSPTNKTPSRSFTCKPPTKSFGDELRRKLKEENEKALALLKLTLAAQDKGQVTNTELLPFTASPEEQKKDVTYKQMTEAKEDVCGEITTSKEKPNEYEDQVPSINLSLCKLPELHSPRQTDNSNEKSETSSSLKTELSVCVQQQPASLTPPLIPLPPLPPNEPQPAPPLPATANDVTVVTTYTSFPMSCSSQPPQNYMPPPPPTNDMYMPYMNPEMHQHHNHHNPYMYHPPPPGYQMGNEGVPPMFHQPPPPHMMTHPQNSYGPPPYPYMHNTFPVPMPPYQNTHYQAPYPSNFTCHQNIVTMSNEPMGKKTAPSGPILMEIGSDSDNSLHSPVLPQNPTIQEAIQFVKHKMLKNDIQKAISENKTAGVDNGINKKTENTSETIIIEDDPKRLNENKHESDDSVKCDTKIKEDCNKTISGKMKPVKFSLQSKSRPFAVLSNTDVFGNSDNDCENFSIPKSNQKKSSKKEAGEQPTSKNTIVTNKETIGRSPVIYSNVLNKTSVKSDGCSRKCSENVSKAKDKQTGSETKSDQTILETIETAISSKTENRQFPKKNHENNSNSKSGESQLNNHKNRNKKCTQNNDKIPISKQEESTSKDLKALVKECINSANKSKVVLASSASAELQKNSVKRKTSENTIKTADSCKTETIINEKQSELKEHGEHMKADERNKLVHKKENTELKINEKQPELKEHEEQMKADERNKLVDKEENAELKINEKQPELKDHEEQMKTDERNELVNKEENTELKKSGAEGKAAEAEGKNKTKFLNIDKSSETQVVVLETNRNETETLVGKTRDTHEVLECDVKNKTASKNETRVSHKELDEKHIKRNLNESHNKTHSNIIGNKEAKEIIICQLESVVNTVVSSEEKAPKKEKVNFTDDCNNKCSEYRDISVEHSHKEAEHRKQCVVLPDEKLHTEIDKKKETIDHAEYISQDNKKCELNENEKVSAEKEDVSNSRVRSDNFNTNTNQTDVLTDKVVSPLNDGLPSEESYVPSKTLNKYETLDIPVCGTICDKHELSEEKKVRNEKEDMCESDIQDSHFNTKHTDEVITPASKLLNEENNVSKKIVNEIATLDAMSKDIAIISRKVCVESELNKNKERYTMKEDISASSIQNSGNLQMITEESLCEDKGNKPSIKSAPKKKGRSRELDLLYGSNENINDFLQNEDQINPETNTKRTLRNRCKQFSRNMSKKINKLGDSKVKDIETHTSEDITHRSNDTAEKYEIMDIPEQKETIKQAPVSEKCVEIDYQEKTSKTKNKTAAVQFEQADTIEQGKVCYRACPLSKKTPRELTMMFLNDSSNTVNYGMTLKYLRIKLVRVETLPLSDTDSRIPHRSQDDNFVNEISSDLSDTDCRIPHRSQDDNFVNEISSDLSDTDCRIPHRSQDDNFVNEISSDSPSLNKSESKRKTSNQNGECLLTQPVTSVEEKYENNEPLIQSNELPQTSSKLCENHKKILKILNLFKNNKITGNGRKRKEIVLKIPDRHNSINFIDFVPLSSSSTNVTQFDKLNPAQGQIEDIDFTEKEEHSNKMVDHEEEDKDCRPVLETTENTLPTISGSLDPDQYQYDVSLRCRKQRNKCFEHKEDSNDSSKIIKKTVMHSELRKEFNSETEDSLLGEFASNDSNASLTCEQVSSNSLILKINRSKSKKGKKKKIKLHSVTDNDLSISNADENNINENAATSIHHDDKISFSRFTDSQDVSMQSDENFVHTGRVAELAVFDFKEESSCDTRLGETYLSLKKCKSFNKKFKIKRKRKVAVDDQSDDLVTEPKILRSSKTSKLEETEKLSPFVTSEEVNKTKTDISNSATVCSMLAAVSEDKKSSWESQTVTSVSVSEGNTENLITLLTSDNVKNVQSSSLWEKISRCLNVKQRNVTTQVRYRQFTLSGEVSVEDTDIMSNEREMSLSDVISALSKLHESV